MSVASGHSGHSNHSTNSEYIDIKVEKQKLYRLKKSLDRQQQQLNDDKKQFTYQLQQYQIQKNKIPILEQTISKLKFDLQKMKKRSQHAITEIQLLKQKELSFKMTQSNYIKQLRHSRKETLNIKKRLKLALTDMDKQSKYYEQKIKKTDMKKHPTPQRISLINETSKNIDIDWSNGHQMLINVTYKPSKVPNIRKSITSPTGLPSFDNSNCSMLSPVSASPTPSPSSHGSGMHSPREAYKLYIQRMKKKENPKLTHPKLTHPKLIK